MGWTSRWYPGCGILLGRLHPGYPHPRHYSSPEGDCENHGKGLDGSTVNTKNFSQKWKSPEAETRPPGTFLPVWVKQKCLKFELNISSSSSKVQKNRLISRKIKQPCVCEGWTRTSGLLAMSSRRCLHPLQCGAFPAFWALKSSKTRRLFLSIPQYFSAIGSEFGPRMQS